MSIEVQHQPLLNTIGFRILATTIAHPLEYAKFLIQIGHEPLPAYSTTTMFGKPKYMLPNVFQYVKYIKGVDGYVGCYRGLTAKLTGHILGMVSAPLAVKRLKKQLGHDYDSNPSEDELTDEEKIKVFNRTLIFDIVGRSISVVVSHPFVVITTRMMAEFVGGEQQYTGVFASILEIYKEQGIGGFFSGLMPRWSGELATLLISSFLIFGVNNYVIQDREFKTFTIPTLQYLTTTMTYPMNVVASCMEVNNCGLAAGMPPHMPVYKNWRSCFSHLSQTGKLYRGSGLFFRYCPTNLPSDLTRKELLFQS